MASPDDDTEAQALIDELNRAMSTPGEYTPSANFWRRRLRILKLERLEAIEDKEQKFGHIQNELVQVQDELARTRTELFHTQGGLEQSRLETEHTQRERDWHSQASAKLWNDVQREHELAVKWWTEFDAASKTILELQNALAQANVETERWRTRSETSGSALREIQTSRLVQLVNRLKRYRKAGLRILGNPFRVFHLLSR